MNYELGIRNMEKEILEIRSFAEPPKLTTGRTIEGYAVVFGVRSQVMYDWADERKFVEMIDAGAISDELLQRCDVRALVEHNSQRLLARSNRGAGSLTLELDAHGLKYRFEAPNTTHGNDILEMVNRGDIAGSSFAFRSRAEGVEWRKESGGLWLRTVKLIDYIRDVTMTADPAYTQTEVSVRSMEALEAPLSPLNPPKGELKPPNPPAGGTFEDRSYIEHLNNLRKQI